MLPPDEYLEYLRRKAFRIYHEKYVLGQLEPYKRNTTVVVAGKVAKAYYERLPREKRKAMKVFAEKTKSCYETVNKIFKAELAQVHIDTAIDLAAALLVPPSAIILNAEVPLTH